MKTIIIPRIGESTDAFRHFFNRLNINCVLSPKITKRTFELGNERIDELMCFPAKVTMGNFREALEQGYDTLVMWDSCGSCRLKCYWSLQKHILNKLGYKFEMVSISPLTLAKQIRYLSNGKSNIFKIFISAIKAYKELKIIEKDVLDKDITLGLIGEIYTINCPEVNMDMNKKLKKLGVGYKNYVTHTRFIGEVFKFVKKSKFEDIAIEYMPHKRKVGGHGYQSILHLLEAIDEGLNGAIHISPFPCSPESVVSPILDIIAEENNFPLMHLIFDEHTGEAGIETRLEAFVDNIKLKKEGIKQFKKVKLSNAIKEGYIGLDCGSISTKAILMNEIGDIVRHIYIETKGNPIESTKECLRHILPNKDIKILGFGVTGSSRKLVGKIFKADLIKNEITAQTIGCLNQNSNIKTIIEIGGQDSKIITLNNGIPTYYNMNSICSAGTGSFLSHQAKRMGLPIDKFAECGYQSECPTKISGRCGVFAESDLIHKQAYNKQEDLIAGLNKALAINYIKNVARNRRLEEPIFFSGGVSCNKGVVKAFKEYLGKEIIVSEFNKLTGAIGIALLTKETISKSSFDKDIINSNIERKTKFCDGCGNQCEVTLIYQDNELVDKFNDKCGNYDERTVN